MNIGMIAGSNRKNATSTRLVRLLKQRFEAQGHTADLFILYEKPLPLYDPDRDYSADTHWAELNASMLKADAIVLATPEYHGSMSGVLKNALDFLGSEHFNSKPVLAVASAGGAVGVSSLSHIQAVVRNLHGINCPEWISIGGDQRRFGEDGEPSDPKASARIKRATDYFLRLAQETKGLRG